MYVLLLRPDAAVSTWCSYVGCTARPKDRIGQRGRKPPTGGSKRLQRHSLSISDVLYMPLQVVKDTLASAAEVNWTVQFETIGVRKLNCFATYGNPANSKYFWQRKHAQKHNRRSGSVLQSDSRTDVVDLT